MTYEYRSKFGRSSFRSPRGRGTSFRGRGRGGSDSYHSSSSRDSFSSKPSFRGSSFQSSSYRGRNDHRDSRGRGTHRFSGERDRYPLSHSRKDEESSFHRRDREMRESASGSFGREHSHSRRSDGEPDRKRMRPDGASSFKEGYSSRRSYDEYDHPNRSFNSSSSSPYRSDSSPFGGKSYKKDFNDFKKPLPPLNRPSYSSRRPMRGGSRGRISSSMSIRPSVSRISKTPMPSLLRRTPMSRFKPTSRLQLILRKKKQIQIMRMRREQETRLRPSSSGKPSHIDDSKKNSSANEEPRDFVNEDADMVEDPILDDGPPGVSSPPHRKDPIRKELDATSEKPASQSESPKYKERSRSPGGFRRIALKCPHCKFECKMFKSYQAHLITHRHKAAMEKLLYNLKQKLRRLRTEQREEQRIIDERDDNFNRTSYCKLCKLNYKQTRQEHMTSDFHVSMSEFLNSKCKICRMDFATPLLYEHHRCTLTHIKRKAFLERKGALKDRDKDEENNEEENFMVLDSVESADESNEETESSKEKTESLKKTSLEVKKKTTIIGSEYIKKVSIYYCKLCKLCLHYNPNRDPEDGLLNHCRTRFHLKRFSLEDAKKNKTDSKTTKVNREPSEEKSADNASVEPMDANDEENDQFWVDDEVAGDDHKSSEDEDDSHSEIRYDRFSTSDEKDNTDKIKAEPEDTADQSKRDTDKQQNAKSD